MLWAAFVSFIGGVALLKSAQYLSHLTAVLTLLLFLALFLKKKPLLVPVIIAGALFALVREKPLFPHVRTAAPQLQSMSKFPASFSGYASPATRLRHVFAFSQLFHITGVTGVAGSGRQFPYDEIRLYTPRPLSGGKLYEIQAMVGLPEPRLNPGFPNSALKPQADLLWAARAGPAPFVQRMRSKLNSYYMRNFPPDEAGLLMAVTTGERAMLTERTKRNFSNCGLAHLISIAGLHFGMFSLTIFLSVSVFLRFFAPMKFLERLTLHISPKQIAALVCLPLLLGYLLLSGMRIPALRAFIMISFFLVGLLMDRRRAWLSALWFAAFVLVLWRPDVILDASFQMSFLSVLIIGHLARSFLDIGPAGEKPRGAAASVKKYLMKTFIVSLSLAAGLAPLIAYYFNRVQFISPVANVVVVPIAGFLLVPLAVLCGFVYLAAGIYPFHFLSGALASVSIGLARFFASIPYSSAPVSAVPAGLVLIFYGFLAAYMLRRKKSYLALAAAPFIIWAGFHLFKTPALSITFLDDGTGESAVLELPDGKTAVMDTGVNGLETADFLRQQGKSRIDFLILSHVHHDHTGGARYLAERFRVGEVWDNGLLILDRDIFRSPERRLSRGDYLEGRGYKLLVLHPYKGFFTLRGPVSSAVNNTSLVVRVEDSYGHSALFTGDIEREAQQDLLSLGGYLGSDVYKVPHHGSKTSAWQPFIRAVHPSVAVIAPGGENDFGFPSAETLQALSACGVKTLRTDTDGAVKVDFKKDGIRVKTYRQSELLKRPRGLPEEFHNLRMLFSSW
ncbi:MAG: DNA internalization-related competence protein ComEC/Rec2 [Nitrospiraceae bacterium]|nr:DNA internalization-related competence protein ComEC/Rec2 [Nitrospiraceae bacterium]